MTIKQIYEKYSIPPNLQEHMISVTRVMQFIRDHWIGDIIDWNTIITSALLHDLGNIVRFDFKNHPEFLGSEINKINYWIKVKEKMIKKYGDDDHEVTKQILKELSVNKNIADTILNKSFGNSINIAKSKNWNLKILHYGDMRVTPSGIGTLEDRITDIKNRGKQYQNRPDLEDLFNACRDIEKQIQEKLDININLLTDKISTINKEKIVATSI